jgi:hypothetical protein
MIAGLMDPVIDLKAVFAPVAEHVAHDGRLFFFLEVPVACGCRGGTSTDFDSKEKLNQCEAGNCEEGAVAEVL